MVKKQGKPVYVRDEQSAWAPALQIHSNGSKAVVVRPIFKTEQQMLQCGDKQKYTKEETIDLTTYPNKVLPMQNVDASGNLEDYKDMVQLPYMHEAAILYNLKKRHMSAKPYTRTGDIVLAVNPYKWYKDLYTEKKRAYYSNRLVWESPESDPRGVMEPHVYEVSALSYRGLAFDDADQSILVSGESGAGKTETVKICLNHIASTQRGQVPVNYSSEGHDLVVQRIVDSNPLLEAFGNAKTRRNDNSSRFGKYLQLQFEKGVKSDMGRRRSKLVGSKCEVYLLEKNRVVGHDTEERTFHIFYQLLSAPNEIKRQFWERLVGATNESFTYVGHTKTTQIEGKQDGTCFSDTLECLREIGITGENATTLMRAICIVMQLGNIGFAPDTDTDRSVVSTPEELKALSELMGVTEPDLIDAFTSRTMKLRKEAYKVPLNAKAAKEATDALAKEAYQKVFFWVVNAINCATAVKEEATMNYGVIGMLDIFGFESFLINRFEQLCINYANEKLQQKFTEDIFRNVQEEYKFEGIPLTEIQYDDNTDVLDLIEGRTGLLAILNEECIRPKGNDFDFVQKALALNKSSSCLVLNRTDRMSFGVQHYAGKVMYDGEFFVQNNQDTLPTDLQSCASKSSNDIIRVAGSVEATLAPADTSKSGARRKADSNIVAPTVWTKYKSQLNNLMTALRQTRSRYIRCIKPNSSKEPLIMEHQPVVEQLQCAGVIAGITIARSVFPNRLDNGIVLARYSSMWDAKQYPSQRTNSMTHEQRRSSDCKALLLGALSSRVIHENGKTTQAFVVGKTKTYFRAGALEWLEANRLDGLDAQATLIQKYARRWLVCAKDRGAKERREFEEAQRLQRKQAECERLIELKRQVQARKEAIRLEKEQLQARIAQLKGEIASTDRCDKKKVEESLQRAQDMRREIDDMKERFEEEKRHLLNEPKTELAQQRKKLEEGRKLITFLKKENKKIRGNFEKTAKQHEELMSTSSKILDINSLLGGSFDDLNEEATKVHSKNSDLSSIRMSEKELNEDLRSKVTKVQDMYMDQANARLELQRSMARILNLIQENCRDGSIVEEAIVLALQCESEAKSEMAALEISTGEPGLAGSDVSDTEGSLGESWTSRG
eukprot:scaffold1001_cov169-Amphora_coffeaeformis.AAC.28